MTSDLIEMTLRIGLLYLLPVLWGRAGVMLGLVLTRKKRLGKELDLLPYYFGLGLLMIFGLALFVEYVVRLEFGEWFFPLVWGLSGLFLGINLWKRPRRITDELHLLLPVLGMALLVGMSILLIWWYRSPYPLNWDWNQHQQLSRLIQEGKFSFFTSHLSDTFGFNSYPPILHILIAITQKGLRLWPTYAMSYWQLLSYFHLVLVGVVSWRLGSMVGMSQRVGYLSLLLGMMIFDSAVAFTNLFFLPQTVAAVLWVFFMADLIECLQHSRTVNWWKWILSMGVLVSLHYLVGGVGALLLLAVGIYTWLHHRYQSKWRALPIVPAVTTLMVIAALFLSQLNLTSLNQGEAASYSYQLSEKQVFLEHSYGWLMYIWVPIGVWVILKRNNATSRVFILVFIAFLLAMLTPLPYVLKLFTLMRFWVLVTVAVGVDYLLSYVTSTLLRRFAMFGMIGIMWLMLVVNVNYWKAGLLNDELYSHVNSDEIELANLLFEKYTSKQVLIVSDPSTQFILEGMSGVDSLGGAYMKLTDRVALKQALESSDRKTLVDFVDHVEDGVNGNVEKKLVIISGRTLQWLRLEEGQRQSLSVNIWKPMKLSMEDREVIDDIDQVSSLKKIFDSKSIVAFER